MGLTDTGKQQAQVIIDFGLRGDDRARRTAGGPLLDSNGGRQTFDMLDIRFLQLFQKLAGVTRQAFHVAALALGVNRIKRQTGFPRPGQTGDHNKFVFGNRQVDIL